MNRVEFESFLKSFILFFLSLSTLAAFLVLSDYKIAKESLSSAILSQMRVCSYDLKCEKFGIDFVENQSYNINQLHHDDNSSYAYFPIEKSYDYILKLSYQNRNLDGDLQAIKDDLVKKLAIILVIIALVCVIFSFYALYPLRQALHLTKEFARDILHDFNTPLSVLRLNAELLVKDEQNTKKVTRIQSSVDTILALQGNLRSYLDNISNSVEEIELKSLVMQRVSFIEKLFPNIIFYKELNELHIKTNLDVLSRVIDNLLTNAAKYNKDGGSVKVVIDAKNLKLSISDTGVGIDKPKEVFKRFYTENKNGVGIGLHIVKKLCDDMHVKISLQSTKGKGSVFELDLSLLTKH